MLYRQLSKAFLFRFDAEKVHDALFAALRLVDGKFSASLLKPFFDYQDAALKTRVFGLDFSNPIGLAAGFDKHASAIHSLAALGFGAIELGTITNQPQPGNEKPRIFRLPEDRALINRMGFPSDGVDRFVQRLNACAPLPADLILGLNIGKTKIIPLESALEDYLASFKKLKNLAHYFVINVSSPNTPELRKLQSPENLSRLLAALQHENSTQRPLLVKISPDLSLSELDQVIDVALQHKIRGLIASNTTLTRDGLQSSSSESGGLSGTPLKARALQQVRHIFRSTEGRLAIVGVGGIFNAQDAFEYFSAGASLVQIYTGLIYEGPWLVRSIKVDLAQMLRQRGLISLQEIVGRDLR